MNPVLRTLLLVGAVLIAGIFMISNYSQKVDGHKFETELTRLKQEFIERGQVGRHIPADRDKDWKDEVRGLTRWYFEELAAIYNRHPNQKSRVTGMAALRMEKEKGKIKEADWPNYEEWGKITEENFKTLREGKYDPMITGSDKGLHLDILAMQAATNPSNKEKAVRIDFALWGGPRRIEKDQQAGTSRVVTRTVVPVQFRQIAFKFIDDKGHIYGEMSGSAEPYQKIVDPERWVEDFPPQIMFGTWYVDLFPREATKAEVTLNIDARGVAGADVQANYRWEIPVRDDWKLSEGESFKADTLEMPKEYIQRKEETPTPPN
jgi:hypothetical protein